MLTQVRRRFSEVMSLSLNDDTRQPGWDPMISNRPFMRLWALSKTVSSFFISTKDSAVLL